MTPVFPFLMNHFSAADRDFLIRLGLTIASCCDDDDVLAHMGNDRSTLKLMLSGSYAINGSMICALRDVLDKFPTRLIRFEKIFAMIRTAMPESPSTDWRSALAIACLMTGLTNAEYANALETIATDIRENPERQDRTYLLFLIEHNLLRGGLPNHERDLIGRMVFCLMMAAALIIALALGGHASQNFAWALYGSLGGFISFPVMAAGHWLIKRIGIFR